MANTPAIPRPTVPFLNPKNQLVDREWYLFLANLFNTLVTPVGLTGDDVFTDETFGDISDVDLSQTPTKLAWVLNLEQDVPPSYLNVPKVLIPTTPDRTLVGKCLEISAGITIPANVFSATGVEGDLFTVFNNTSGSLILTQGGGLTLRLGGTTTTGNRTVTAFGLATLWFPITTVCIAVGNVT